MFQAAFYGTGPSPDQTHETTTQESPHVLNSWTWFSETRVLPIESLSSFCFRKIFPWLVESADLFSDQFLSSPSFHNFSRPVLFWFQFLQTFSPTIGLSKHFFFSKFFNALTQQQWLFSLFFKRARFCVFRHPKRAFISVEAARFVPCGWQCRGRSPWWAEQWGQIHEPSVQWAQGWGVGTYAMQWWGNLMAGSAVFGSAMTMTRIPT